MNCTPDRIEPRIINLRRTNTPWEEIARILGISLDDVEHHALSACYRLGVSELTKDTLAELTRKVHTVHSTKEKPIVSKRQLECLRAYAQGLTYQEIALSVGLHNPQTVQNHVSVACKALGIQHAGRHRLQRVQERIAFLNMVPPPQVQRPEGWLPDVLPEMQPDPGHLHGDPCF